MTEVRKYSSDAGAMVPREGAEHKGTSAPVIMHTQPQPGAGVGKVQKEVRAPVKSIIGSLIGGMAIAGATLYAYETGYNPFKHDESAKTTSSASTENEPKNGEMEDLPDVIDTPEKLKITLEKEKIRATAVDFAEVTKALGKRNIYLDILSLEAKKDAATSEETNTEQPADAKLPFHWKVLRAQGFEKFRQQGVLLASMLRNKRFAPYLQYLGVKPSAVLQDPDNELIRYHYYECVQPGQPDVATVVIKDERGRNLTLYPMQLPTCAPKEAGVE